ncbi:MAG: hypothetical protein KAV41_01465 [Candidatus Pacebacteria bacterium]|nr:hypothetical protein [Candidatus Paceibacterota bacterium]
MAKGKSNFNYLQEEEFERATLHPNFFGQEKDEEKEVSSEDEDTSHLSDERHEKFSPSSVIQNWRKKRSGSFVR